MKIMMPLVVATITRPLIFRNHSCLLGSGGYVTGIPGLYKALLGDSGTW